MSVSTIHRDNPLRDGVPFRVQIVAWVLGLGACVVGMLGLVAEWSPEHASVQLVLLAIAPILFMIGKRRRKDVPATQEANETTWIDWSLCLFAGSAALAVSAGIGIQIGDLPPAYHDEYSYLFQARTLLAGHFSFPSPARQPELFDQMHVLNEGRMASRYYPGTGIWLAPFVALRHPYLGQWIAGAIATMLIYWTGVELGGRLTGFVASLAMALSPGIGLFANMLLAHHPTLLALCAFLLGMIRWRRTRSARDAWTAGSGLGFAMLCRPMTAAAVALPFGLDVLLWLAWSRPSAPFETPDNQTKCQLRQRSSVVLGLGIPLLAGAALMVCYNHAITGQWFKSPYQLYTDVYTPRHVFGFNNVVRGEQHLGPRVIEYYDRWAQNLTPSLAAENVLNRWLGSWLWTFDLLPLLLSTVVVLGTLYRLDRRWALIGAAIVSLHVCHVPYWYVGIMGWHYVFETAPLWCLWLAGATTALIAEWRRTGKETLCVWWWLLLAVSLGGVYAFSGQELSARNARGKKKPPRLVLGINSLAAPRRLHAEYRSWIEKQVDQRPALVLVDQEEIEKSHLDLVVNDPGLKADVLLGRYRTGVTDLANVCRDFPDRHVFVVNPARRTVRRID